MKQAIAEADLDSDLHKPKIFLERISRVKENLESADDFLKRQSYDYIDEIVARVYPIYQNLLLRNNARDFNDLLVNTVQLFEEKEEVLSKYRSIYRNVLVDEFQDTDSVQFRLAKLISEPHNSIFVVGDPNQSIYRIPRRKSE